MDWMDQAAERAEARLQQAGIALTLGGEPTYIPLKPEGAEWTVAADGPTKLPMARAMAAAIQRRTWPGSTLLYCSGKRYEGEVNPRWALRLVTGRDGQPIAPWP
ncbi:MAG: transglutaminase family protein, partial [Cyanobium sp.]